MPRIAAARKRPPSQPPLFDVARSLPNGFVYRPDFLTIAEEESLLTIFKTLPFENAPYHEYTAKRRVLNFGWSFDKDGKIDKRDPIPDFLVPLTRRIAKWANIPQASIIEALTTEYPPTAGVGWHCDNERCEHVIGISLGGWADMELRPLARHGDQKDVSRLSLEPRSAYLMQKDSRWKFQHQIRPVPALRYSITFRTI